MIKRLSFSQSIVQTLEGNAVQLPEDRWLNDIPLYEIRKNGGIPQIYSYRRMNDLHQLYQQHEHNQKRRE